MLPFGKSKPLHPVINPPKPVTILPQSPTKVAALPAGCTAVTIDLKVLIIATDGTEADLPAITQTLDYLGTPYTIYLAAKTPNGLTPDKLSNGCHGFYQGVIVTTGDLGYFNGTAWVSALSQQEWTNLWTYQATMGVRMLSWYTYPNANYGYQPPSAAIDTSSNPLASHLTTQGQTTFSYLNPTTTVTIQYAYTYLAKPLTDGATTSLVTDASGNTLAALRTYADGRQAVSLTFDSNPNLLHSIVLSYGLVNWLTKGLFLGERHTYMSAQIDDFFIDDSEWLPTTPCGTPVDNTGATYRITSSDLQTVLNWQTSQQATKVGVNTTLTMAFNGFGAEPGAYNPDTLTPFAINNEGQFNWVSHTYDHTNLDSVSYATAVAEITQNVQAASNPLRLTHFSPLNMVTPDVSGLTNANFLKAAYDNGIRYLVSDTSQAGYSNPSPNAGIYNSLQPQILLIPRRPNNLFYNVSTPNEWVAEYNCIYQSFWGRALSYQEILDVESQTLVTYMLKGDLDPWMFHQPNLRAYDGKHTLLGDLLDLTMKKYAQYYNLVVMNPTMDALGQKVTNRMQYNGAGVTASIIPGVSITITAQKAARVPVTGLNTPGAENYGGQFISYVNLAAGQSVTLPLK
ncbi:MAG TPA: hypothetical protein VFU49_03330 [Ktedonobacteraceae bacterium]|nr:hypothetical protein [Ktedonobacteraceae bacterium]